MITDYNRSESICNCPFNALLGTHSSIGEVGMRMHFKKDIIRTKVRVPGYRIGIRGEIISKGEYDGIWKITGRFIDVFKFYQDGDENDENRKKLESATESR